MADPSEPVGRDRPTQEELKKLESEDPSHTTPGDVSRTIALGADICLGSLRAKAVDERQSRGEPHPAFHTARFSCACRELLFA